MNVQTITMPADEAREAFRAYRTAVKARHSAEDEAIMRGYKAIAKGQHVLDLSVVMKRAGVDASHRPHLAICRADQVRVWFRGQPDGSGTFVADNHYYWNRRNNWMAGKCVVLPSKTFDAQIEMVSCSALLPLIPPQVRPRHALSGYHILWEAEWTEVPRDPILLKRLHGHLYAVLAQWDLTDLERAVLVGRLK